MKKLNMFCLTMDSEHLDFIKQANYIPVGLGTSNFSKEWFRDNTGNNIAIKNKYYGEYTFHYWLWKNYINNKKNITGWFGFCQYRKYWSIKSKNLKPHSINELKNILLTEIPESYQDVDIIIGNPLPINEFKRMKFLKKGLKLIARNPKYLFNKKSRNIKFHFDLMHGYNNLDRAIQLLDKDNKNDFRKFVNTQNSFSPHNMFICKSPSILENYYSIVFPWLKKCEDEFGFSDMDEYGTTRIYGFLAERFMSYWFKKNYKYKTMPIVFYDIRKNFNQSHL